MPKYGFERGNKFGEFVADDRLTRILLNFDPSTKVVGHESGKVYKMSKPPDTSTMKKIVSIKDMEMYEVEK